MQLRIIEPHVFVKALAIIIAIAFVITAVAAILLATALRYGNISLFG